MWKNVELTVCALRERACGIGIFLGILLICAATCPCLHAADTLEPCEPGAADFELYTGVDGLGMAKYDKSVLGDVVLGYGILERLSGYWATTLVANEYFANGNVGFGFGVFGNVLNTRHVDLDLVLDFSGAQGVFAVTPAVELNLDSDLEMTGWGVYIRGCVPMYGRDVSESNDMDPVYEFASQIGGVLGLYIAAGRSHQFLAELDAVFRPDALPRETKYEIGNAALGYNVMLTDRFELINQVYVDVPQNDENYAIGISTGFIATLN